MGRVRTIKTARKPKASRRIQGSERRTPTGLQLEQLKKLKTCINGNNIAMRSGNPPRKFDEDIHNGNGKWNDLVKIQMDLYPLVIETTEKQKHRQWKLHKVTPRFREMIDEDNTEGLRKGLTRLLNQWKATSPYVYRVNPPAGNNPADRAPKMTPGYLRFPSRLWREAINVAADRNIARNNRAGYDIGHLLRDRNPTGKIDLDNKYRVEDRANEGDEENPISIEHDDRNDGNDQVDHEGEDTNTVNNCEPGRHVDDSAATENDNQKTQQHRPSDRCRACPFEVEENDTEDDEQGLSVAQELPRSQARPQDIDMVRQIATVPIPAKARYDMQSAPSFVEHYCDTQSSPDTADRAPAQSRRMGHFDWVNGTFCYISPHPLTL